MPSRPGHRSMRECEPQPPHLLRRGALADRRLRALTCGLDAGAGRFGYAVDDQGGMSVGTSLLPERSRWFEVDGQRFESGPVHYYAHRIASAIFTADLSAVQQRLPADQLHPVRWVDGRRALVWVSGLAYDVCHSQAWPLCRYGEMAVGIVVTTGERPAPPMVPLAVPALQSRYPLGNYMVQVCVTNRLFGHGGNVLMGTNKFLADVRNERRGDHERFIAAEQGTTVFDLTVSTRGRPADNTADWQLYTDQDGSLLGWQQLITSTRRMRLGRDSGRLVLGDHPAADDVRALGLSENPVAATFEPDRVVHLSQLPSVLGPAGRHLYDHPSSVASQAAYVVSYSPGVDVTVDQGLIDLRFDLQGQWMAQPISDLTAHSR